MSHLPYFTMPPNVPVAPACLLLQHSGIFLHLERNATHVRRDGGSVLKPSLLERYLHRPEDNDFDDIDIFSHHSNYTACPRLLLPMPWTKCGKRPRGLKPNIDSSSTVVRPTKKVYFFRYDYLVFVNFDNLPIPFPVYDNSLPQFVIVLYAFRF